MISGNIFGYLSVAVGCPWGHLWGPCWVWRRVAACWWIWFAQGGFRSKFLGHPAEDFDIENQWALDVAKRCLEESASLLNSDGPVAEAHATFGT